MSRVKRSVVSRAYRKSVLKAASGYRGRAKNCYTVAIQKVEKGLQYHYRDRKHNKRNFRSLWIIRINAALRLLDMKYSTFMGKLNASELDVNRKMLAEMAVNNKDSFEALVKQIASA